MEEATEGLRTEAIQTPNDFAVVAVFLESEKIETYSLYLHAQTFFILYEKGSLTTCILYNIP